MPAEFLGLNRNGGFAAADQRRPVDLPLVPVQPARALRDARLPQAGYTFGKSLDTLSSDRSLVEHDPTRPENNYGLADYDRTHRLTTAWVLSLPGSIGRACCAR